MLGCSWTGHGRTSRWSLQSSARCERTSSASTRTSISIARTGLSIGVRSARRTYSDLEGRARRAQRNTLYNVRYPWRTDGRHAGRDHLKKTATRDDRRGRCQWPCIRTTRDGRALVGKDVLVPAVERRVKIIAPRPSDPASGRGALKITPGHDATDFESGSATGSRSSRS